MKTDGTNPPGQEIKGLIDINCHILPGMEDGPDDLREAAEMLRIAYDEGIRTIVATPPYNKKNPIMDGDKLDRIVEQLNIEAGRIDPYYKVYLGREIEYNDENHQKIISGQLDSMADSKYVMIRFQYDIDFETISEAIRDINMDGYIPIVADVEQYECLESDEDKVEELIQLGAYVQISAAAVLFRRECGSAGAVRIDRHRARSSRSRGSRLRFRQTLQSTGSSQRFSQQRYCFRRSPHPWSQCAFSGSQARVPVPPD